MKWLIKADKNESGAKTAKALFLLPAQWSLQNVPTGATLAVLSAIERSFMAKYPGESSLAIRAVCQELLNRLAASNASASASSTTPPAAAAPPSAGSGAS